MEKIITEELKNISAQLRVLNRNYERYLKHLMAKEENDLSYKICNKCYNHNFKCTCNKDVTNKEIISESSNIRIGSTGDDPIFKGNNIKESEK